MFYFKAGYYSAFLVKENSKPVSAWGPSSFCYPGMWCLENLHVLFYSWYLCSPPQPHHLFFASRHTPASQVEPQGQNTDEVPSHSYTGPRTGPGAAAPSKVWRSPNPAAHLSQYMLRNRGRYWFWFLYSFVHT